MIKNIKWGILGCGRIAEKFASDILLIPDCQLIACASKEIHKATIFAEKFQIANYYGDYESMLKLKELDVIYIATTHNFHFSNILLCLENGKNVLCEKPLCVSTVEVNRVVDAAKSNNLFLMEAMWTAFLPAFRHLVNDVKSGLIGDVRYLRADFGFRTDYNPVHRLFNPSLAGGCILDIGIYPLYASYEILGKPETMLLSNTKAPTGVEIESTMHMTYLGGATASLYSSINCNTRNTLEIFGTNGSIWVPGRFHEISKYTYLSSDGVQYEKSFEKMGWGYSHQIDHVNDCNRNKMTQSDIMTFDKSKALMEIMEEAIMY